MRLGINPGKFKKVRKNENPRTDKDCIMLVKNAGFEVLDYSASSVTDVNEMADFIHKNNLTVIQSHAPMNRYKKDDYDIFKNNLMTGIEKANALSSKIYVVHGDEFDFKSMEYSRENVLKFNYDLFAPVVEYAKKHDMKVAFETVFEEPGANPRFCSLTEDLIELTESFKSDNVGICWDFGHAKVQYGDKHIEQMKSAGKHIICTHVHDNLHHYNFDIHLMPFFGNADWESVMKALKEIGYKGDFTFELVYEMLPERFVPRQLEFLYDIGKYLLELYN